MCECEYEWNGIKANKNQIKIRKSTWTCNLFSFDFAWRTHGHKRSLKCATAANTLDIISIIKIHRDEMLRFSWTLDAFFCFRKQIPKREGSESKLQKSQLFCLVSACGITWTFDGWKTQRKCSFSILNRLLSEAIVSIKLFKSFENWTLV